MFFDWKNKVASRKTKAKDLDPHEADVIIRALAAQRDRLVLANENPSDEVLRDYQILNIEIMNVYGRTNRGTNLI